MENSSFESINTGRFPGDSIVVSTAVRYTLQGENIAVTRKAAAVENYGSREQEIHDRNYKLFSLLALSDLRYAKGRNSTLSSDSISGDIECEFV